MDKNKSMVFWQKSIAENVWPNQGWYNKGVEMKKDK